ncbi:GSCOCG00006195001-RA-CDS [Cotesia congregata]|nr:GSCOCG00006195001-RA-CDS [Cotesia congregata]
MRGFAPVVLSLSSCTNLSWLDPLVTRFCMSSIYSP